MHTKKSLSETGIPISTFKQRVEHHLHHRITNKQFKMLFIAWARYYVVLTHHDISIYTPPTWLKAGYVPKEHANNLMNYLVTGERVV